MAILWDIDKSAWEEWVSSRPPIIQALCHKYPHNRLYRLAGSGHRVLIYAYCEDGTVKVNVLGKYNVVAFERTVFDIDPSDLTECDEPDPDELVGTPNYVCAYKDYISF